MVRPTVRRVIGAITLVVSVCIAVAWRWTAEWLYLAGVGADGEITLAGDSAVIPIQLVRNLIIVPVRFNGLDANFILDCGLQFTVLNADRAGALASKLHGRRQVPSGGMGHRIPVAFAAAAPLQIGHAEYRPRRLPAIPLSFLEPYIGERIDGIIGHDLLAVAAARVDYDARTLTLWHASRMPEPMGSVAIPIYMSRREAHADVTMHSLSGDSVVARLKLDTGSPTALGLDGGLVRDARLLTAEQARRELPGIGLTGETQGEAFLLRSIRFGGRTFQFPLVHATPADSGSTGGIVGAELLRQFTITFDYQRARLWLQPTERDSSSLDYDRSGIMLLAHGQRFDSITVHFVEPGSPGARAGVLAGDVIVGVDDSEAEELRLSGVASALMRPGASLRLRIARDRKSLVLALHLPEHFPGSLSGLVGAELPANRMSAATEGVQRRSDLRVPQGSLETLRRAIVASLPPVGLSSNMYVNRCDNAMVATNQKRCSRA